MPYPAVPEIMPYPAVPNVFPLPVEGNVLSESWGMYDLFDERKRLSDKYRTCA